MRERIHHGIVRLRVGGAVLAVAGLLGVTGGAQGGDLPISVLGDTRTLQTLGYVIVDEVPCPPEDPDCPGFEIDEDAADAVADAAAFDASVDAAAQLNVRPLEGGEADSSCSAQQTSSLTVSQQGGVPVLTLVATGTTDAAASVDDPLVANSYAECFSDSFLDVTFRIDEPASVALSASLEAEIVAADLFQPGAPLVAALLNGTFATLTDVSDVPPGGLPEDGEIVYDLEVRKEGQTDDPMDELADGMPAVGDLDEEGMLEPGTYTLSAGAATLVFGFENALADATAQYSVSLTVTVPEPDAPLSRGAVLLVMAAGAARRRRVQDAPARAEAAEAAGTCEST